MYVPYTEHFLDDPSGIYMYILYGYPVRILIEARDDFTNVNCSGLYIISL